MGFVQVVNCNDQESDSCINQLNLLKNIKEIQQKERGACMMDTNGQD